MPFDWVIKEGGFLFLAGCKPESMLPWSFEMTEEMGPILKKCLKEREEKKKMGLVIPLKHRTKLLWLLLNCAIMWTKKIWPTFFFLHFMKSLYFEELYLSQAYVIFIPGIIFLVYIECFLSIVKFWKGSIFSKLIFLFLPANIMSYL